MIREALERVPKVLELRALLVKLRDLGGEQLLHLPASPGAASILQRNQLTDLGEGEPVRLCLFDELNPLDGLGRVATNAAAGAQCFDEESKPLVVAHRRH